ncbi:MAG: hypothetical protein KC619_03530 [Myxococcales bacterium]|nr:hypothetical protein [Myxococcales bacterium]
MSAPEPLRRFAERNLGAAGAAGSRFLIEQAGEMRSKPTGRWMSFSAEQWFAPKEVAFCWHARVRMAPLVTAVVDDAYEDGHGRLDVKVWGAVPVTHQEGPDVDRGEAMRYLAELPMNPAALLHNPDLRFDEGPEGSFRVWTGDPETYVDLHLDRDGDVVRIHSRARPRGKEGPTPWEGRFRLYTESNGVRAPRLAEVAWLLPGERFTYWRGEVTRWSWER